MSTTMRLLLAVKSCQYDQNRGAHQLIRDTWGRDIPIEYDLRFFVGEGGTRSQEDEHTLDCGDGYIDLPEKTRAITRWSIHHDYDFVFLCDTGSLVIHHHFMNYGFEKFDYLGYCGLPRGPFIYRVPETGVIINPCYPWASGGGYFLSRRAAEVVAKSRPIGTAEDLSVSLVLSQNQIFLEDRMTKGYKGYIVDWIESEDNSGSLDARREWMTNEYERITKVCRRGECSSLIIPRLPRDFNPQRQEEERPRFISPTPWDKSRRMT